MTAKKKLQNNCCKVITLEICTEWPLQPLRYSNVPTYIGKYQIIATR